MKLIWTIPFLLFATVAFADDPCEGRNPKFCAPAPGPIIVESIRVKPSGCMTTTHDTVVTQDGKVLYVRKGQCHNSDVSAPPRGDYR